jgi:hypothetical protein
VTRGAVAGEGGGRVQRADGGITLQTDEIDLYHAHLRDHGVDVDLEVGRFGDSPPLFWFRDPKATGLMVVEAQ